MDAARLTRRQQQYLHETFQLQNENRGDAIHYSDLAERLSVSKNTAYSVLRRLEEKGCVRSQFSLPQVRVGRSSILFKLTNMGYQSML